MAIKTKTIRFLPSVDPAVDAYRIRIYSNPGTFSEGDPYDQVDDTVNDSPYVAITTDTLTQEPSSAGNYDIFVTAYDSGLDVESDPLEFDNVPFYTYTTSASMATITIDPVGSGRFRLSSYTPTGGFGVGNAAASLQTAAFQNCINDAADWAYTNSARGVVEFDVPEVEIEQASTLMTRAITLMSNVRITGMGMYGKVVWSAGLETSPGHVMFRNAVMKGTPTITASGDTFTSSGTDDMDTLGFRVGQTIKTLGAWSGGGNEGEYVITGVSGKVLTCAGASLTAGTLNLATSTNRFSTILEDCEIDSLEIDGNKANLAIAKTSWGTGEWEGIDVKQGRRCHFHDLYIHDVPTDAIDIDDPYDANWIHDCLFEDNGGCGIHWGGNQLGTEHMQVYNITGRRNSWYRLASSQVSVRKAAGLISFSSSGNVSNIHSEEDYRAVSWVGLNAINSLGAPSIRGVTCKNPGFTVPTVAMTAGGTGYAAGDLMNSFTGGTGSGVRILVQAVSGGVITSFKVWDYGTGYAGTGETITDASGVGNNDATFTITDSQDFYYIAALTYPDPVTAAVPNGAGQVIYLGGGQGCQVSDVVIDEATGLLGESCIALRDTTEVAIRNVSCKNVDRGVEIFGGASGTFSDIAILTPGDLGVYVTQDAFTIADSATSGSWATSAPARNITFDNLRVRGPSKAGELMQPKNMAACVVFDGATKVNLESPKLNDADVGVFLNDDNSRSTGSDNSDLTVQGGNADGSFNGFRIDDAVAAVTHACRLINYDCSGTSSDPIKYVSGYGDLLYIENICPGDNFPTFDYANSATAHIVITADVLELINTGGSGDLTVTAAAIFRGTWEHGQEITLFSNYSGGDFVWADATVNIVSKNATSVALGQHEFVTLRFNTNDSNWYEV